MPRKLSQPEFVALLALLFATVAFSVDSMLPALPGIAAELTPQDVNRAQLVITSFMLGLGIGTLFTGPLSDAWGRKTVITAGLVLYGAAAFAAAQADTLDGLLVARLLQGIGAAAPRVVGLALVRDLYSGREMARMTSLVMMIFILVPAVAPALGALIIDGAGLSGLFYAFIVFAAINTAWLNLRQQETLAPQHRRPLSLTTIWAGTRETLSHRLVRLYIAVLALGFGQMFAMIASIQPIYADVFDKAETFPLWFAGGALLTGIGTTFNARYVMTLGMRRIAMAAYAGQTVISLGVLALELSGAIPAAFTFPVFFFWSVSVFFMAGLTFGNLTALTLEPLGHVAGLASSAVGAISTIVAALIAAPIGLAFDGTIVPMVIGSFTCSALALLLIRRAVDHPEPAITD